jgi:hypothetical protein
LYGEDRSELIHVAINGLRAVALARGHLHDLWSALTVTLYEFTDGEVAHTARLHVVIDAFNAIVEDVR